MKQGNKGGSMLIKFIEHLETLFWIMYSNNTIYWTERTLAEDKKVHKNIQFLALKHTCPLSDQN